MTYTIIKTKDGAAVVEWIPEPRYFTLMPSISERVNAQSFDNWQSELSAQPQIPVHPKDVQYFLDNWLYKEMPEGEFVIDEASCCLQDCACESYKTGACKNFGDWVHRAIRKEQPHNGYIIKSSPHKTDCICIHCEMLRKGGVSVEEHNRGKEGDVWEKAQTNAIVYAEKIMQEANGDCWDRKDHIHVGNFYMYYIQHLKSNYNLTKK